MKLTTLLLVMVILQVSASSFAQKVTLSEKNASIEKVLEKISSQTGYDFLFTDAILNGTNPISIHVKNAELRDVLQKVFERQPLEYSIEDKSVVISKKSKNLIQKVKDFLELPVKIQGKVTDTTGTPLPGASIRIKGQNAILATGTDGGFSIDAAVGDEITVSFIGYKSFVFTITKDMAFQNIVLRQASSTLNEVIVSTGYQDIPKERATGSFERINNELLNRRVSTDFLSRLEGVVPGLLFNRNTINGTAGGVDISIRGTNTLFANSQPLVVIDGFPYDGDFNNINPNDIESISVLKDAAAASIWGAQSGNGVIVVTTKKGQRNQKLIAEVNASITIGNKPDLYYNPNFLPSNDFINIEQDLFNKGYYDSDLNTGSTPVSPVVQILANQRAGTVSTADATSQINALRNIDVRDQLTKYFYQKSVNQQYALNLRGGNANSDYVFSLGNNQDRSYYKGNKNGRTTLNSSYNFYPVKNLQISAGINYIRSAYQTNSPLYSNGGQLTVGNKGSIYPYAQLVDANGNALPIAKDYALNFTNTANSSFLDWNYRPLDELNNADNTTKSTDNRINLGIRYSFLKDFKAGLKYQYEHTNTDALRYYSTDTYYARDLINLYTQEDAAGNLTYPIPVGGILQQTNSYLNSQRARFQLDYNHNWDQKHELTAIAGAEISETINGSNSNTSYGYDKNTGASYAMIDYSSTFTTNDGNSGQIPNSLNFAKSTDHYISYFSNAAYSYKSIYTVTASGRIDKSNLFGVNTNQKAVPLYSTGLSWNLSKEDFYHLQWLPYVKIRATYGYTGNINKNATAVTTIQQYSNSYYSGVPFAMIANPGNPELRWEKTRMINLGLDYTFKNDVISGSIEYYTKKGTDLFGYSPLAPSTGLTTFFGNTADTKGNGLDITINTKNIDSKNFKWTSNFLLSHVVDIVTKYNVTLTGNSYIGLSNASSIYPLEGKSLFGLYSYKWAGLEHTTGNPQGYLNGQTSTDYSAIISGTTIDNMVYNGSSRPTVFGSLRNTFSYKALSLSLNIVYKLNYYFRRTSYISSGLPWSGNSDYYKRWQNPGDESTTSIPSLQYPPYDGNRESFYQYSSILIEKGDHIRLQDISLNYTLDNTKWHWLPFTKVQLYSYVNNVGILWRANNKHLDPDLSTNSMFASFPQPRSVAFGVKANF